MLERNDVTRVHRTILVSPYHLSLTAFLSGVFTFILHSDEMQWLAIVALFIGTGTGGDHLLQDIVLKNANFTERNAFMGKGWKPRIAPIKFGNSETLGTDWFTQTYDHFNPDETRTFEQQWFYNYKYGSPDGPNFLMFGGAYPENMGWVMYENVTWMIYAKAVGVNVFCLAHRYYGESKLGTNDLQYLTSAQMLYDVATFIRAQQEIQKLTGPWITFGGSYAGNLAAWSREWFPDLILGSVASSAPVQAKNDFYESLEVVQDVIRRQSQKCYHRIAEAFARFRKLTQDPEERALIQEKFNLYPPWTDDPNQTIDPLDMNTVFNALYGIFEDTVLNNDVGWMDMKLLCSYFENDTIVDPLDGLSELRHNFSSDALQSSFDATAQHFIDMKDFIDGHGNKYDDDELTDVLWMWQTCNEFGHYQTTDYGDGIFGTALPINYFIILCERVFGIGMDHVESGTRATNNAYGGRARYNTTNVVFVNGDADPWHALSILERGNLDESVAPVVIKGTSHCADMYGESPADPPEMVQARKTVLENIQKWLAPDPSTESDPYCNCAVDSSYAPVGWNYNDIWLDVVFILDTSEAMSDGALAEAGALIESFISDGINDFLITDTKAPFSTRVGVTLYNLNMTKTDKVEVSVKKGVKEINDIDAFNAATSMFDANVVVDRAYTRQVVYYITESEPNQNLSVLDKFKQTQGVIIVNSQIEYAGLSKLASDGYYFINGTTKQGLQAFCKANCFCKPDKVAYTSADATIRAARGCYTPHTASASFSKARTECATEGGIIATDHNGAKGAFIDQILKVALSKSDYFWIGYTKLDDDSWRWEDESSSTYANWDMDQPSNAKVAKCAYVDSTTPTLAWGSGNCNIAFPFLCEAAPCSVGNKMC